ncbi:rhamnose ABC transporter substrate-binding protein [Geodermatophilus sp. YIM 151500]|uniref:rhamnose ABC transporter substrate-binding protein n=1 Tax=Geodermatophilus sp. YIM 151500 TaxID=2984531 RepID=UPI0021E44AFF|nr:rhamnose ABC transporter substrate-binding protein [Geodermatophilus sp. YIM 151500]MCV2490061.1 rhamnose ABC transporter substrate-binding protein [Geodermatophilus sp. YIM 151500]
MSSFLTGRRLRGGLTGVAVAALVLTTAACGGTTRGEEESSGSGTDGAAASADPNAEIPSGLAVAFLPKQVNNPYFDVAAAGADAAVSEIEGEFTQTGPSEASASSQVSYINTLTQQGSDVILTSANDPNAICSALDQARSAGAAVVTFDSDTSPDCRDLFVNQATAEGIAQSQVDIMAEQIGGAGQVAILSATANATNQNAWIELMEQYAAEQYPEMEIVATVYGDDEDEKSFQETQGLLQTYPELEGIISPTTVGIAAAARYLSGSEYKGRVALTGLGTPNQLREYVEDGTVQAFALWNPEELGYLAAHAGAALAAGRITGQEGETFEAGELGEYTIGADGVVVLGEPTVFTADNIGEFDF